MSVLLTVLSFAFTVISLCIVFMIFFKILAIVEIFWAIIFAMLGFSVWCIKRRIEKDDENNKLSDDMRKQNEMVFEKERSKCIEDIHGIERVMTGIFVVIWLIVLFCYK